MQETDKKGVNVLVDFIGKDYWKQNMEVLGLDGHMVILAFMSGKINFPHVYNWCLITLFFQTGASVDNVDITVLLRKRLRVSLLWPFNIQAHWHLHSLQIEGSNLRARSLEYQARLRDEIYQHAVLDHFAKHDGTLKVFVDKVFNWEDIIEAHKYLESNQSKGKIVVKVTENQ